MSEHDDKPLTRGEEALRSYLDSMERSGELIKGAAAKLFAQRDPTPRPPADAIAEVTEYLATGHDRARYLNAERPADATPTSELRRIARRLNVRTAALDDLVAEMQVEVGHKSPGEQARAVVEYLEQDYRHRARFLRDPGELPGPAKRVAEALRPYAHKLRDDLDVSSLAMDWAGIGSFSDDHLRRTVAQRLADPWHAKRVLRDGEPLEYDPSDERFRSQPTSGPIREYLEGSGRYSSY